ncbi:DUF4282 domain-containing protein [Nocardia seriolae]|uniref:Uncharacterized protein n=1 Tax=Nocardia seriolae TaxID=37332 RepID=A0A0B8NGH5_9NOCA|nr:DUF4282 domain-containing protein [Nocardia seriolae]APA94894.1 hypothetical protein NS506_00815 [Nocardia seriolae]MTJ60186.1 DUF4282 domain-containing protein [Nocardia seriolae]MTJ76348.1 DUF4282 domain-containing protein [Nocardia seriolae]MTJ85181.1 DUF4282 domain-containing protein [Nocardia seriolae]MTK29177.1 DUF4282 domain-containing protein [Nocardia seriolae]
MADQSGGNTAELGEFDEFDEIISEGRWAAFKESATRRMSRRIAAEEEAEEPVEPFSSPSAFGSWSVDAARALLDVQFHRAATRTLLPLAYLLGLAGAFAIPIVGTVGLWRISAWLGIVFAVVFAIPLGLVIAATVRLLLEFVLNASRLAGRVSHIADMADDLFQALSDVAEPVNQLSKDVQAVQFWRFRKRSSRK